ncbi:MAG: hypothetical protein JO235_19295 [Chroococcidiopsidaceae cyanobacterium CP_BM_RX_35]|nr:hypothetical protein [Chroococcidiopsidaceae cyanobacterium CP_BM_RX_35]
MLRKVTLLLLCLTLCWTTVACGGPPNQTNYQGRNANAPTTIAPTRLSNGNYPVQQATYNDVDGEYTLFLLNTPPGESSTFRAQNLPMARLTDEEIKAGQKSYLKVENGQSSFYLTPDFQIAYVHNVTETQTNPQTGQPETVVVRRENGFWTPFAGAVAGQVVGNLLFRPQYYMPPVYQPGVSVLRGYGGYGNTYSQAAERYQSRYNVSPPAVRNRNSFRTTGRIRTPSYSQPTVPSSPRYNTGSRSTGSGYGSSTLRQSGRSNPYNVRRPAFGSSGSRRSAGSFGSRRR